MTHPYPNRRFVPQAVLIRSGKINTAGASVNTDVRPVNTAGSKTTVNHPRPISNAYKKGYSQVTKPFNKYYVNKNSIFNKKVNTIRVKDTTVRDRAVGNPQQKEYKEKGVIDSGCSRHMTGNKCYLTEYEDYDGGFVSFRDGKGRILESVSQICDKKNNVLFTDTECLVLSSIFKLLDESQVLLRVPRKDNIYCVDLKSVVPTKGNRPDWLFDIDSLTISMNYVTVVVNQTNGIIGTRDNIVVGQAKKKIEPEQEYILIPLCITNPLISQGPKDSEEDVGMKPTKVNESGASDKGEDDEQDTRSEFERLLQQEKQTNSTNSFNTVGTPVSTVGPSFTNDHPSSLVNAAEASNAFEIFGNAYDDEDVGAKVDLNNLETTMNASPILTTIIDKDHPKEQIIRDLNSAIQTRRMTKISDEHAMKVWTLVNLPNGKRAIGTKWVFRNKKDKRGIVVRNKARLVAQDGCKAFLYGTIEEEVYVCQPPSFEDPQFPDKVYKVEKALYGLHQARKAWYKTLSTYLIEKGFRRGTIDNTLFIKKDKGDILLVQVYVDDIIFGSTKKSICDEFEGLMHKRFQMSSIGELTFFLGLQVQQKKDGIFISQDKYVAKILKKFDFATMKTAIL
ncbi:putative ribonuclease H-like domain-containing protein [Tanacetum coccineum]